MTEFNDRQGPLGASLSRRRVLQGMAGAAIVGATGFIDMPAAFAAGTSDFAPWFGPGGKEAGGDLIWVHGLNLSMTGQGADFGTSMERGARLATEVITASGGPKMSIALNDHQSGLVPPAVQGVRRLISQDKINSLASSYGAATEAIFPLTNQFGVTTFWTGGPSASGLNRPNVFVTIALWAVDATAGGIAYMAKQFKDAKRLAILGQTENGLPAVNDIAPKAWKEASGGDVVYKEVINAGGTDFSSSISQIRAAKPDVIFTTLYGNDGGFFIKQVREAGISAPILIIDLAPSGAQIAGSALSDNVYLATDGYQVANPNPYNQAFVKAYKAKHNADPGYFEANFFECTMVLWAAIQRAIKDGDTPGRGLALAKAIEKNPVFPSLYGGSADNAGEMTFNKDHSVTKPMGVFKIGDGGALTRVASIMKNSTEVQPA
ncbi:ABC transporter substrate-binding protein [Rhizobium lusitanum]|uniref:ABC transporter substrate-binding protein n=1 Tax=Rhizobium lusitanum TaxID=293958 RepID=A0A6L9UGB4_9HYPH|nr:ABC transporter substrate-binding protein [Rhizobium lusitanum]NEI73668.1 ABC transporter substrate-binding protein [Rhizobium lusitanum]